MSVRRAAFVVAGLALAFVVLAPLTSIDAAQQAGLPLLTDKLWFRIATTVAMFVVMASAWNIIGGLTGYANAIAFVVLVLVLVVRPRGLLGRLA